MLLSFTWYMDTVLAFYPTLFHRFSFLLRKSLHVVKQPMSKSFIKEEKKMSALTRNEKRKKSVPNPNGNQTKKGINRNTVKRKYNK